MSEIPLPPPPPGAYPVALRAPVPPAPKPPPRRRMPRLLGTVATAVIAAVLATTATLTVTGVTTRPTASSDTGEDTLALSTSTRAPTASPLVSPSATAAPSAAPSASAAPQAAASAPASGLAAVVANARKSVVTVDVQGVAGFGRGGFQVQTSGSGSGVIVSTDGYILTAQHVVEGATSVSVTLEDGSTHDATVIAASSTADAALIKISATGLTAAPLAPQSAVAVGDAVLVIGNPLGQYADSVSMGIISGTDRSIQVADMATQTEITRNGLIQTDAAVNEGNSGGPLMDTQGRVLGLVTATATNAAGLGFATPVTEAVPLLRAAGAKYTD
jgi:serine protease Do